MFKRRHQSGPVPAEGEDVDEGAECEDHVVHVGQEGGNRNYSFGQETLKRMSLSLGPFEKSCEGESRIIYC